MAQLVAKRLTDDGIYLLNIVDAFPDARLVKSLVKTLHGVFPVVDIWLDQIPDEPTRATYVVSAGQRDDLPPQIIAQRGLARSWLKVTEPVLATGTPLASLPVLEDDHVPVERLMANLFLTRLGQ